jgi:hypothetical protein
VVLTVLRCIDQIFYELYWILSDVFPQGNSEFMNYFEEDHKRKVSFSVHDIKDGINNMIVPVDIDLDHLTEVVFFIFLC